VCKRSRSTQPDVLLLSGRIREQCSHLAVPARGTMVVRASRMKVAMCRGSALAYWDLSDEIPGWVDLAVPVGAHRPRIGHPPTRVHVFRADTFGLGRTEVTVEPGARFAITDPERTVVDAFRLRHRLGEDLAAAGLRRYLRRPRAKPGRVLELAGELRVRTPVMAALRLMQE
jgi:predicted transcriptional regulator of viral defense system